MTLYTPESRLSDIIMAHPGVISVLDRFGIRLGVGTASVGQKCSELDIDPSFLLVIVNTYINDDYFPEQQLLSYPLNLITDYLAKTDDYYLNVQLPNIERHFRPLMAQAADDGNLMMLRQFFNAMKEEMATRATIDYCSGTETTAEKVMDLCSFFVIHLKGHYDTNLCNAVVQSLFMLEKDVRQNDRIRDRVLKPAVRASLAKND